MKVILFFLATYFLKFMLCLFSPEFKDWPKWMIRLFVHLASINERFFVFPSVSTKTFKINKSIFTAATFHLNIAIWTHGISARNQRKSFHKHVSPFKRSFPLSFQIWTSHQISSHMALSGVIIFVNQVGFKNSLFKRISQLVFLLLIIKFNRLSTRLRSFEVILKKWWQHWVQFFYILWRIPFFILKNPHLDIFLRSSLINLCKEISPP